MKKLNLRVLAEIAIFAALGVALDALQGGIFRGIWVNGGSIGIAMIPVFIIAYRRGLIPGILCGLLVSLVQMLGGIYAINGSHFENGFMQVMGPFIQVMLDYVLTYTLVGVSGAFAGLYKKNSSNNKKYIFLSLGVILGGLLKYFCHVGAGYFWLDDSVSFWGVSGSTIAYSFVYNLYAVFNILICLPIMIILSKYYPQILDPELVIENEEKEVVSSEK